MSSTFQFDAGNAYMRAQLMSICRNVSEGGAEIILPERNGRFKPVVLNGELSLQAPPQVSLEKGWRLWKGSVKGGGLAGELKFDQRSFSVLSFNPRDMEFITPIKREETDVACLSGDVILDRLEESGDIRLGSNVGKAFWSDYLQMGYNSVLEFLFKKGILNIKFPGMVKRTPAGEPVIYSLTREGKKWAYEYVSLRNCFCRSDLFAVLKVKTEA